MCESYDRCQIENSYKMKRIKGFTLIELIIVMAILGITLTIAVPNVMLMMNNSRKTMDIANSIEMVKQARVTLINNAEFSGLDGDFKLDKAGITPVSTTPLRVEFSKKLYSNLSEHAIAPRYVTIVTSPRADRYILKINGAHQEITVVASNGTDEVEIYPEIDSGYELR